VVWVVKIGGSLATNKRLLEWLELISASKQTIVIVPGGGPFADQVRNLQLQWQFSDAIAHHMAILAMRQYGLMLAGLSSQFESLETVEAIKEHLHYSMRSIVWMPCHEELQQDQVVASWDVSADSLAVWLCEKLNADRLILIKAADMIEHQDDSIETLQHANIVDRAFKQMMDKVHCPLTILGGDQLDLFAQIDV
jgi:aspartokinase-like uncharacterized kinase